MVFPFVFTAKFCVHFSFIARMSHAMQVDPLLNSDLKISNYTTAVTRQRSVNSNTEIVFSVRSVPKSCKQDNLGVSQRTVVVQLCTHSATQSVTP